MRKKTKIYYIIGVVNDRVSNVYGHHGLGCIYIFNDFPRLKQSKRHSKTPVIYKK